jgi:predicted permease
LTQAAAQAQLQAVWQQYTATGAGLPPAGFDPNPATERIVVADGSSGIAGISGERKTSLQLLAAILGMLLLMGCVNVGCLLMARTASRQQELAIRLSLGAGKARILRQLLMESALVSLTGGAGGLLLAFGAEKLILAGLRWGKNPIDLALDGRVLAFSLAISLVTGLLCGLAPAVQLLRGGRLVLNLERMARPVSSGRALVVVEVALSLAMVAGAAMFARGLHNLRSVPLGFSAEGVAVIRLVPEGEGESKQMDEMEQSAVKIASQLRGTPGIESVTVADSIPFNDGGVSWSVRSAPGAPVKNPTIVRIAPEYFGTMQIPLIAGRTFAAHDDASAPKATVLSAGLARGLFGDENPVGKSIRVGDSFDVEVVGVAGDIKQGSVKRVAGAVMYLPISQPHVGGAHMGTTKLTVRTRMDPRNVTKLVNDRIAVGRFPLVVDAASSLAEDVGASYFNDRVRMQATSAIGAIALLLIVAGIYGLMAYWVAQRTREIGVRVAIGSTSGRIVRLVLRQSVRLIVIGVLVGVPGAVLAMRALSGIVYGLEPVDIASLVAAALILLATGIAAAAVPAWRAARLDPLEALRVE